MKTFDIWRGVVFAAIVSAPAVWCVLALLFPLPTLVTTGVLLLAAVFYSGATSGGDDGEA